MNKLRPLCLWSIRHEIYDSKSGEVGIVIHYVVLPTNDKKLALEEFQLNEWKVQQHKPWEIKCMGQVSNLTCYSPNANSSISDIQAVELWFPNSSEHVTFERSKVHK